MESHVTPQGSILVWAEDHPSALSLLRMAKRKARELNVPWEMVHVETNSNRREQNDPEGRQALHILTLAEQMGARTIHIIARNARDGVARLLAERQHNNNPVQMLIIGKHEPTGIRKWFGTSSEEYFSNLRNTPVHVIAVEGNEDVVSGPEWLNVFKVSLIEIINCIMAVAVATAIIQMIDLLIPQDINARDYNKPIIYMIACAFAAGRYGLFAGVFTAITSFIIFNVMYVSPDMHLAINTPTDAVNLGLYLIAALVISFFTSQTFTQRERYAARAQRTHALFQLHRVAMDYRTRSEAVEALHKELSTILETDVIFFLPSALNPSEIEPHPHDVLLSDSETVALNDCWKESKATGLGSLHHPEVGWRFVPLVTSHGEVGVLGIKIDDVLRFDISSGRLLSAVADQAALIIERFELGQMMEENRLRDEREKLRSMLLSSVSHDLKTPLASVIGALSVYQTMGTNLSEEHRVTLITTALEEAQRLDSFITNILDMTRLESGDVDFRKEWIAPENILRKVERRMKNRLRNHTLAIIPPADAAEIYIDPTSIEQVLQNLLDNAAKYTRTGTRVEIAAYPNSNKQYIIEVRDHGDGIPADKLDKVFDKYARLQKTDSQVAGTGLGLAIGKSIMQSQGGSIEAANHPQGGAIFTLTFPQWRRAKNAKNVEDAA